MGPTRPVGRGRRCRWLALFALLFCVATAAPVFTAAGAEGAEESSAEAPAPGAPELAEVEREERERDEWLSSPEALGQREASRSAYANLSAAEAQTLLLEAFPAQIQGLNADPARVLSGLEIEKVLGTYGARISTAEGESAIVESPVPVESDLGGEGKEPVYLALARSGEDFLPKNPLTAIELPASAEGSIHLQGEVRVELPASDDRGA